MDENNCPKCGMPNQRYAIKCDCGHFFKGPGDYSRCDKFRKVECPHINDEHFMKPLIHKFEDNTEWSSVDHYRATEVNKFLCRSCDAFEHKK